MPALFVGALHCQGLKDDVPLADAGGADAADDARPLPDATTDTAPPDAGADASPDATRESGADAADASDAADPFHPPPLAVQLGMFDRSNGHWRLDLNGDHVLQPEEDSQLYYFGSGANNLPLVGAFGTCSNPRRCSSLAIYSWDDPNQTGIFALDMNGTRRWESAEDRSIGIPGQSDNQGVLGQWVAGSASAMSCLGVFFPSLGVWHLDANCNGVDDAAGGADAAPGDIAGTFGTAGDIAVVGDWTGSGVSAIGVFRSGTWLLDANGNHRWDDVSGGDRKITFGSAQSKPVVGDWNGDGIDDLGVFDAGLWSIDRNGNGVWDGTGPGGDAQYTFGAADQMPVAGHWGP